MATVIDSLIVTLGLDPANFTKGQKQAADAMRRTREESVSTAKEMEMRGKQGAQFFSQIRTAALGLAAVLTGGAVLRQFGQQASASDAAIGRMARTLGVATDRLGAYRNMAARVGAAPDAAVTSLQSIQDQIQRARLLGQPINPAFSAVGVRVADPSGKARSVDDIYDDVIEALRNRPASERPLIANQLGVGEDAVGLAGLSREEYARLRSEQRALGNVTKAQAEAGQRLMNAWQNLGQAIETTWRGLREKLEPAITALITAFTQMITSLNLPEFEPQIKALSDAIKEFARYLTSPAFRSDLEGFGKALRDLGAGLLWLLEMLGLRDRTTPPGAPAAPVPGRHVTSPLGPRFGMSDREIEDQRRRERPNGVGPLADLYYQSAPSALGGYGGGAQPRSLTGRHLQAYQYFRTAGYSHEAATGLVANLHQESGVVPDVRPGDGGRSHGIAQWNGDRLRRFMERYGKLPGQATLQQQLEYATWELSENGPEASAGRSIRSAKSAREAGQIASRQWLRPGVTEEARRREEANRGDTANNFSGALANPSSVPSLRDQAPTASIPGPQSMLSDPGLLTGGRLAAVQAGAVTNSTSTTAIQTGPVTIQTSASDARGIAAAFTDRLAEIAKTSQAARGLA
jgi:hypothetical protein